MSSGGPLQRPVAVVLAAAALVLAGCGAVGVPSAAGPSPTLIPPGTTLVPQPGMLITVLQSGLEVPWDLAFTPDGRMLVTERIGRIRIYASAEPGAALLGTVPIVDALRLGEGGGLGIAVDRDFVRFPFAYVCATRDPDGAEGPRPAVNELLRYRVGDGADLALDGPPLLTGMRAHEHHNGCAVETDDAGRIWLTMGDANTARGENLAQQPNGLNGRVLRIERDGRVPADNPILPGADARTAAYDLGHRNPQGIAFRDRLVVTVEHGTDRDDEVNVVRPGANYGYACWSGIDTLGPAQEQEGDAKEMCRPVGEYVPAAWSSGFPTIAPSGAVFLAGDQWGDWEGDLVVTTLKEGDLRRFTVSVDGAHVGLAETLLDGTFGRLRAATLGPDGWLYLTTSNASRDLVMRVELRG